MQKKFIGLVVTVIVFALLGFNPSTSHAGTYQFASVTADSLNVRSQPNSKASIIGKFKENEQVKWTVKNKNGWTKVIYGTKTGWVASSYLTTSKLVGTITASSLNVRSEANAKSKKTASLKKGAKVTILSQSNDWYYVQSGKIKGWVSQQYVTLNANNTPQKPEKPVEGKIVVGSTYYVNATSLNVRSTASTKGKVVGSLKTNDTAKVLAINEAWVKIQSGKNNGWVASKYLSDKKVQTKPENANDNEKEEKIVLIKDANIRTGPGTEYKLVTLSKSGTEYKKVGAEKDWIKIAMPDGTYAWVAGWLTAAVKDNAPLPQPGSGGLKGKTIVLDAGHGGKDPGTSGANNLEKTLSLGTVLIAKDMLENAGAKVILTRANDTYISLAARTSISNASNADAFVSIHYNAANKTSSGVMTFYYNSKKDKALASALQSELVKNTSLKDAGTRTAGFHVIKYNKKPSVLLELGFLSNPNEEQLISSRSYQEKSARAVHNGLINYFK